MSELLRNLPASTGIAFVLVQHLDPHHESILAYSDGNALTVVDYKTGRRRAASEQQLRCYALALEMATGHSVRAVLVEI